MAVLFTDPFNGTSGAQPTTMTKTKGGALYLRYVPATNALAPDSTAADIRYRHDTWPGQKNYRAILRFQFHNPVAASRIVRLYARYDEVDKNGYYVQVDTNFNDPEVKLFKYVNGVSTQLGSTFKPGIGTIPVDTSRDIEIQIDGDDLVVWWNGNTDIEAPDIHATDDEVYVHETVGVGCEYCGATDILFENLEVNTPRKHASGTGSATGLLLKVDDVEYDEAALKAANIQIGQLTKSVVAVDTLELFQLRPFTAPLFRPEQVIQLFVDISSVRTRVFHGKLRVIPQSGSGQSESITYTAYGYRANWQYINVEHPTSQSSEIVWNALPGDPTTGDPGDDDYDSLFANMDVGSYLLYWLDYYEDDIKFYFGSDPVAGKPYVIGDLTALTNVPARTTIGGTLDAHIQAALNFQRNRVLVMDYDTGQMRIRDLDSLAAWSISSLTKRIVSVELGLDTTRVFTAARAKGVTRELVQADATTADGSLVSAWDPTLEVNWTRERAKRKEMGFEVDSVSIGTGPGGRDEVVLKSAADEAFANEWQGTSIKFNNGPAMGNAFEVYSNTGVTAGKYTFVINGNFTGVPVAGNSVTVTDDMALPTTKKHNGFAYVYTLFRISDTAKREIAQDKCVHGMVSWDAKKELLSGLDNTETKTYKPTVTTTDVPKDETGYIKTSNPVVLNPKDYTVASIVWRAPGCNETSFDKFTDAGGEVKIQYEFYRTTAVQARYPTEGWYGDAFSYNAAKWGVGSAKPEFGDIGVMREELINDSEFRYQNQIAPWVAILEERVKLTSRAPWAGTISYRGLDWTNRNFTKKISLEFEVGKRGNANWDGQYLIPTQWVWDFRNNLNTVSVGTLSQFVRDLEDQKKASSSLNQANLTMARRLRQLKDMQACLAAREQQTTQPDPGPVCGSNVYTGADNADGTPGEGKDLDSWIEILWWLWFFWDEFISDILGKQKGITNIQPTFNNGVPNGFSFDFGGATYHTDGTGHIYDSLGADVTSTLFKQGFNGIEGAVQDVLNANKKGLEGLTFVEFGTNGVAKYTDAAGNVVYGKLDGSGFSSSSTGVGSTVIPVYGGVIGGILHNLGKTIDNATGLVVSPGTVCGASGGTYYRPDGTRSGISAGSAAPSSVTGAVLANKKFLEGLTLTSTGTYVDAAGYQFRANADGTFTSLTGGNGPTLGGVVGGILANLGKTVSSTGIVLTPGTLVPAGGAVHYKRDGSTVQLPSGATVPPSLATQVESIKRATTGLTPTTAAKVQTPAHHGTSVYSPTPTYGFSKDSGPGLPGPSMSGYIGNLAGKCGSTFDGAAEPGSGPGALMTPGATVPADGAYYYPPTQNQDDPDIHQLAAGDITPASTLDQLYALAYELGLRMASASDPAGVVFSDIAAGTLWMSDPNQTDRRFRQVQAALGGPGTGINGGDYDWLGTTYHSISPGELPGMIKMYASATPPTGYLLCDGSSYSAITYAALFAVIGLTYGNSGGPGTFDVPDMRDRFPQGYGPSNAMASVGGSTSPTVTDPGHTHAPAVVVPGGPGPGVAAANMPMTPAATGVTIPDGRPPFLTVNYIIKT